MLLRTQSAVMNEQLVQAGVVPACIEQEAVFVYLGGNFRFFPRRT